MATVTITPNPKTIASLRHLNYTNEAAIADIVDNSIDAGAKNVSVDITKDTITIADDGCGMDEETLIEAIKLGSNTDKDDWQLGRFGMGLVTAGISLAPLITVQSTKDNVSNLVELDIDHILETNEWECKIIEAFQTDKGTGTIVTLGRVDNMKYSLETTVRKTSEHLSEVFRRFIEAGVKVEVNGSRLVAKDPLRRQAQNTDIMFDEDVKFSSGKFHLTIAHIDSDKSKDNSDDTVNQKNQGFYIMRNNRQIARAIMLENVKGLQRHPNLNRFRAEVSYDSELDDLFGINFMKDKIVLCQALVDKLTDCAKGPTNLIKNKARKETANEAANKEMDHSDAEEIIHRKRSLLPNPTGWKAKRSRVKKEEEGEKKEQTKPKQPRRPHENAKATQPGYKGMKVRFEQENHTPSDPLYSYDFDGDTIIVSWNTAHPFYQKIVAPYNTEKDISSPIDLLVFSMVKAEIQVVDGDDQAEKILQFREEMSRTLRTLLN